jgi:hypothetical protein
MKRATWKRLAAVLATTTALLAAGELYFRTKVPVCGVTPFRLSAVPGLSCELRPSFATTYKGERIELNSLGCRGPEFPPRRAGVLRIALVGDSMTFGSCVPLEDTLGAQLERALAANGRESQVLDLGVPGYTASDVAAVVVHKALALEPDVIVYVFYANDVEPAKHWDAIPQDAVIDEMQGFALRSALLEWVKVELKELAFDFGVSLAKRTPEFSRSEWTSGGGERVTAALTAMRDACRARGVELVFADYPHMVRRAKNPFRPIDELALAAARQLGIASLDAIEAFAPDEDLADHWANLYDHHPDGVAHGKVAALLARELAKRPR